jgi:hypothetical protein
MWWYMYIFTYRHHKSIKTIANVRIETSLISLFYSIEIFWEATFLICNDRKKMDRLWMIYLIKISVFSFRFKTMAWKTTHTNVHIMYSTSPVFDGKYLIFGYKISDKNYYGVNYFITILGFSIYKSYYLSLKRRKQM